MYTAVKFAYDGRKFHGYARQPQLKTVEGKIIKSLIKHGFIEDTKESYFRSASRTDKGVSALSNVIAFDTDSSKKRIFQELKGDLADILIYGIKHVKSDFYPRYAKLRTYRYYLKNCDLKIDKVLSASSAFAGEHNFSNFAKVEAFKDPLRSIDNIVVTEQDDFLIIDFYAQTFLWNQIRRIISAVEKTGNDKLKKEQIIEALHDSDKKVDFGLASPKPLILKDIVYDFEFEYPDDSLTEISNFEKRIVSSLM